jgi:arginase
LLYIGIRSLDKYERKIIQKYNINYINVNEVNNYPEESLKIIKNFVGNNPTHLSFDVDVMDPSLIPCTGTPVENGLHLEETKFILDEIKDSNIINMDITELNLEIGTNKEKKTSFYNFLTLFDKYFEEKDNLNSNDDNI